MKVGLIVSNVLSTLKLLLLLSFVKSGHTLNSVKLLLVHCSRASSNAWLSALHIAFLAK